MSLEQIIDILNPQLLDYDNRYLNSTELLVLRGIWNNQTYQEIAQQEGYSTSYFANVVAPELCRRLSNITQRRVTKKNCRAILQSYILEAHTSGETSSTLFSENLSADIAPNYPCGAVPLNSPFYLTQTSVENQIIEELAKPGALVRIKAPQERGKTSLLLRILDVCEKNSDYQTINLDLQKADQTVLQDINHFLRWLCVNCAHKLKLKPNLDDYWDEDIGSKMSWTIYFEEYILDKIETPLIFALDEVNQIFEHPQLTNDFFPLLRSCYEEAKRVRIWQKLRFVIVHSTEIYVPLKLEQSPFNVGLPIELEGFNEQQIMQLAQKYRLNLIRRKEVKQLMAMVGGYPALVHLALYHLYEGKMNLEELLKNATTTTGIYSHQLQHHWVNLQEQSDLASAFQTVCNTSEPILLDPIVTYKLNSMGLIHLVGNKAIVGCRLYQEYFQSQWSKNEK